MSKADLTGKAKELEVASQLIKKGLLVFWPLVDIGADLIASSKSMRRLLPIQVKYRKTNSAIGVGKKYIGRVAETKMVLAFIIGDGSNQGIWYIPLKQFLNGL